MGLIDRIGEWLASDPPPRKSYQDLPQEDPASDIADLGIEYFWCRCEELLPSDWAMGLFAVDDPGRAGHLMYEARAALVEDNYPGRPLLTTGAWQTPLRAIEKLFYLLRDAL